MSRYPVRADGRVNKDGDPLPDTIADLTIEPTLTPGETVTVPCDICEGDPEYRTIFRDNEPCWRCSGAGTCTIKVPDPDKCPSCDADLTGEQISREHMSVYGATHFSNKIGLYANDMTQAWMCPHCSARWSRWDGKLLDPAESIEQLHRAAEGTRYISGTGQVFGVHRETEECSEFGCCIHNPSDHEFSGWLTHYNWELEQMERVNPEDRTEVVRDPDDLAFHQRMEESR